MLVGKNWVLRLYNSLQLRNIELCRSAFAPGFNNAQFQMWFPNLKNISTSYDLTINEFEMLIFLDKGPKVVVVLDRKKVM